MATRSFLRTRGALAGIVCVLPAAGTLALPAAPAAAAPGGVSFSAPVTLDDSPGRVQAGGDVDDDGLADVVTAEGDDVEPGVGSVYVSFGRGVAFDPPIRVGDAPDAPYDLDLADLDADGDLDIVVGGYWADLPVEVLLGDGTGDFLPAGSYRDGASTAFVEIADVTADGIVDLVLGDYTAGSGTGLVRYREGDGTGAFGAPVAVRPADEPPGVSGMHIADLDLDGLPDLLVSAPGYVDFGERPLELYWGLPGGGFEPVRYVDLPGTSGSGAIDVADVTGDGQPDIVADSPINVTGRVLILPGLGGRGFGEARQIVTVDSMGDLEVLDIDGDGVLDIIGGRLSVLAGLGAGEFAPVETFRMPGNLRDIADVTNDGRPDTLYQGSGLTSRGVLVNTSGSPLAELRIGNVTVSEAEGVALVTVLRFGAAASVVTAAARPVSGTALAGVDVAAGPLPVRFGPGETVQVIPVPLLDDRVVEPAETFSLALDDVVGAVPFTRRPTVTILDPDPVPGSGVTVIAATGHQARERDREVTFTLSRSGDLSGESSVAYEVRQGTASAGQFSTPRADYDSLDNDLSGRARFAPGATTVVVGIRVFEDTTPEPTETLYMTLTAPSGATLSTRAVQASILASDTPVPTVSITGGRVIEGDSGGATGEVALRLAPAVRYPVTVLVQTDVVRSTATAGTDYLPVRRWVTFTPGASRLVLPVTVLGDTAAEDDESVVVTASPTGGEPVAGSGRAVLVLVDDD